MGGAGTKRKDDMHGSPMPSRSPFNEGSNKKISMNQMTRNANALFLAAGVPAGVGFGLVGFFIYQDIPATILVAVVGFNLIGFCLLISGIGFARIDRNVWWATITPFVLLPILGMVISFAYFLIARYVPVGNWEEFQNSPEQIEHFLPSYTNDLGGYSFFVQGKSGKTYSYECLIGGCNWVQKQYPQPGNGLFTSKSDTYPGQGLVPMPPMPPGRIIESHIFVRKGTDIVLATMYIRISDDRIFYWETSWGAYSSLIMIWGFAFFGLIAGISASIAVFIRRPRGSNTDQTVILST